MNLFIEIASEEKSDSFEIIDVNYLLNLNVFHRAVIFDCIAAGASRGKSSNALSPQLCRCKRLVSRIFLLLSGDVSTNPGPVKFPCTVSSLSVKRRDKALQCDGCQLWSHIQCVGITNILYQELQDRAEFSWQCPSCLFSALSSFEACEDSFDVCVSGSVNNDGTVRDLLDYARCAGVSKLSELTESAIF